MLQKPAGGPGIQVDVDANGALADQLKPEDHNDPGGGKIARFQGQHLLADDQGIIFRLHRRLFSKSKFTG